MTCVDFAFDIWFDVACLTLGWSATTPVDRSVSDIVKLKWYNLMQRELILSVDRSVFLC